MSQRFFEKWFTVYDLTRDTVVGLSSSNVTRFKAQFWSSRRAYLAIKIKISNLFWALLYKFCDTKIVSRTWQGKLNKWDKLEFAEILFYNKHLSHHSCKNNILIQLFWNMKTRFCWQRKKENFKTPILYTSKERRRYIFYYYFISCLVNCHFNNK